MKKEKSILHNSPKEIYANLTAMSNITMVHCSLLGTSIFTAEEIKAEYVQRILTILHVYKLVFKSETATFEFNFNDWFEWNPFF